MGSPSGERQRSEAVEQIITSRADQMFQVCGKSEWMAGFFGLVMVSHLAIYLRK